MGGGQRHAQMKVGRWFQAAKRPTKTGRKTAQPKESTYPFSGDVEEVKCWRWCWWWGKNHCLVTDPCDSNTEYWRTSCLGSVFMVLTSYQPLEWGPGGQEIDSQRGPYTRCVHKQTAKCEYLSWYLLLSNDLKTNINCEAKIFNMIFDQLPSQT
jgi:hypothetical protein